MRFVATLIVLGVAAPVSAQDGAALYKQHCMTCHETAPDSRAPSREVLQARSAQVIVASLEPGGVMQVFGKPLSLAEKQAIAAYLTAGRSAAPPTAAADPNVGRCPSSAPMPDPATAPMWNGWGNGPENTRYQSKPGITAADVPKLTLKWAFGFEGATSASGQPAIAGGRVFVGNVNGMIYSLDAATGCTHWTYKAGAGVRTAMSVGKVGTGASQRLVVFFGDLQANVYGLDANTGAELWKTKVDSHPFARITGAPSLHADRLYVPVSSVEEVAGARPNYPCCTFRGSVVAIDTAKGNVVWKTYMIPDEPKIVGKTSAGTARWKSAGAAIWTSPTIDVAKSMVYVATGNAYTDPAAPTSDAIVALDMKSGAIQWVNQATPNDVFVINCKAGNENCPDDVGPDFDFGNSPILRTLSNGKRILLAGQKSGVVYGFDPDDKGKILWQFRAGKGGALGGIEWGSAADTENVYAAVSDVLEPPDKAGGLFAIKIADGSQIWHTPAPALTCKGGPACTGAQSAAVSVIPGVVFSGSVDGHIRGYSTTDGKIIWDFDTIREYETVNGVKGSGGSIDAAGPVIAGGLLLTNSGYGQWRGKPGNVLLAFAVK